MMKNLKLKIFMAVIVFCSITAVVNANSFSKLFRNPPLTICDPATNQFGLCVQDGDSYNCVPLSTPTGDCIGTIEFEPDFPPIIP